MDTELAKIEDILLEKYQKDVVKVFIDYCVEEQYNKTSIEEDIEEEKDSIIYEYIQSELQWNEQETNQFVQVLKDTINSFNTHHCNHDDIVSILNQHKMKDLLKEIKINDQLLVFGYIRNHSMNNNNINIPIEIINYLVIYSFKLRTFELNCIVNNDLMISTYKRSTISIFFNFCKDQEYLEQANILEDIKEFDESFIAEYMQTECNWNEVECMSFINLLHIIISGKPMKHLEDNKSVGFAIPSQIFQMMMNAYLPLQHHDHELVLNDK